jgi:hypothetical protein
LAKTTEIKKRGRPRHTPTEASKKQVMSCSGMGVTQASIAQIMDVDEKTLKKYYRKELETGREVANMQVAQAVFKRATSDKYTPEGMFWLKSRAGWEDTPRPSEEQQYTRIEVSFASGAPSPGAIIDNDPTPEAIEKK